MSRHKSPKTGAILFRIILFANLIAIMAYGAITPHEMVKVTAECVTIGVAGLAMAVQVYVTLARFTCIPYAIWAVIGFDGLCIAGWCASIAILSYWDQSVVYAPRDGDPTTWFQCADVGSRDKVLTDQGVGTWLHISWCEVHVEGKDRLIGNGAARQQLHVLIGLSAVSFLFTSLILFWTVRRGQYLGLIKRHKHTLAA